MEIYAVLIPIFFSNIPMILSNQLQEIVTELKI